MRFSTSINFLFAELPFLDRFAAAADAGFEGVEIQILPDIDIGEINRAAREADIKIALLNLEMGDFFQGGPGLSGTPGRESLFAASAERAVEAAARLDIDHLHVGPSRIPDGLDRYDCLRAYQANLSMLSAMVRRRAPSTSLVIEAMNRVDVPRALFQSVNDVAAMIEEMHDNASILFDVYHVAMNGEDVIRAFAEHRDRIAHVQYSNIPGRHEPGVGALDVHRFIETFRQSGYDGWFGAEYHPTVESAATLGWLKDAKARISQTTWRTNAHDAAP